MDDEEKKDALYRAYKPLRNHLKKLGVPDSLCVIWHYMRHLHSGSTEFPDIEVNPEWLELDHIQKRRTLPEWELEVLIREVIIHGWPWNADQKTLRKGNYLAGAVNKLKDVHEAVSKHYISVDNVIQEMGRIAHQQFIWPVKTPTINGLTRYYKIFSSAGLDTMLEDHFGLKLQDIYTLAVATWGYYQNKLALDYPPNIELTGLTPADFDKFMAKFTMGYEDMRKAMIASREVDDRFFYAFNPLRRYPLIRMKYYGKESLVCPDPIILYWRLTDGIYYEVFDKPGFSEPFGTSFQNYIGEVLEKSCQGLTVHPEQEFGSKKDRKRTIDWIVDSGRDALFLECKTKRLRHDAKAELLSDEVRTEDLEKMADFVVQAYKSIRDYRKNHYPQLPYKSRRRIYPVILTLEDWLIFGNFLIDQLDEMVKAKMKAENLPDWYLEAMPYSICPIQTFENVIQVIAQKGIHEVMDDKCRDSDKKYWDFAAYTRNKYHEEWNGAKFLFEEDFERIFPEQYY